MTASKGYLEKSIRNLTNADISVILILNLLRLRFMAQAILTQMLVKIQALGKVVHGILSFVDLTLEGKEKPFSLN